MQKQKKKRKERYVTWGLDVGWSNPGINPKLPCWHATWRTALPPPFEEGWMGRLLPKSVISMLSVPS